MHNHFSLLLLLFFLLLLHYYYYSCYYYWLAGVLLLLLSVVVALIIYQYYLLYQPLFLSFSYVFCCFTSVYPTTGFLRYPCHCTLRRSFFATVFSFNEFIFVYVVNIRFICDGGVYLLAQTMQHSSNI